MHMRRVLPVVFFCLTAFTAHARPHGDTSSLSSVIESLETVASRIVSPAQDTPAPPAPVVSHGSAVGTRALGSQEKKAPGKDGGKQVKRDTGEVSDTALDSAGAAMGSAEQRGPSKPRKRIRVGGIAGRAALFIKRQPLVRAARRYAAHLFVLALSLAVIGLAVGFFMRRRDSERFLTTTRLSIVDKEVRRACNYIEKNYDNADLSVDYICDELVTGAAFLQALFAHELGMSVDDFIVQVRMNRARMALGDNPDTPPAELALMVGYGDEKLFARTFHETTGVSLDEYKANA